MFPSKSFLDSFTFPFISALSVGVIMLISSMEAESSLCYRMYIIMK